MAMVVSSRVLRLLGLGAASDVVATGAVRRPPWDTPPGGPERCPVCHQPILPNDVVTAVRRRAAHAICGDARREGRPRPRGE